MLYNADTFASFQLGTERDVFQALKQQLMARGDYTTFRWNRDLFFLLIDTFKPQPPALRHIYFRPSFFGCDTVQELKEWLSKDGNKKLKEITEFAYRTLRFEGRKPLLEQVLRTAGVVTTQSKLLSAGRKFSVMLSLTVEFACDDDEQLELLTDFLESLYNIEPRGVSVDDQDYHPDWPWLWSNRDAASGVGPLRQDFERVRNDAGAVVRCLVALTYVLMWRVCALGTDMLVSVEESGDSHHKIYGAAPWHGAAQGAADVDSMDYTSGSYLARIEREMRALKLRGKDAGRTKGEHCIALGEQSNYFCRAELGDHCAFTIGIVCYIIKAPFVCRREARTTDQQMNPHCSRIPVLHACRRSAASSSSGIACASAS